MYPIPPEQEPTVFYLTPSRLESLRGDSLKSLGVSHIGYCCREALFKTFNLLQAHPLQLVGYLLHHVLLSSVGIILL